MSNDCVHIIMNGILGFGPWEFGAWARVAAAGGLGGGLGGGAGRGESGDHGSQCMYTGLLTLN